jgi:hypothetical protein
MSSFATILRPWLHSSSCMANQNWNKMPVEAAAAAGGLIL